MVIGITSYGIRECGTENVPGVYTKVSHYPDWIEEKVWKEKLSKSAGNEAPKVKQEIRMIFPDD